MPYIKEDARKDLARGYRKALTAGELNYIFTLYALDYIQRMGLSYQHINNVMGALEGAKLEFYRRLAAPYEDKKIEENGDVYDKEVE